ncbi:MAG: ABC transporter ATP-binding protein [Rhodocyclaceae bacterium]|nr:MAG: ABC transporter ATP-binding protein [Rhodocyclaceae bacterium]
MSKPVLSARNLTKRFGGLVAVMDVSLDLFKGKVHGVIGTNGAGKSTLTNLLSGDLPPTTGSIFYKGMELFDLPQHRVSRLGIGRSYQKTNIFPAFTVFENVRLAAQALHQRPFQFWKRAGSFADVNQITERAIHAVGLSDKRKIQAFAMSHGEQRQLEIAMCIAGEPEVLLLDEPLAGMGHSEAERMIDLISRLKNDHAIMLIEHDMDAVFSVSDYLTVMVNGQVLESGTPERIRTSDKVQQAYLGYGEDSHV